MPCVQNKMLRIKCGCVYECLWHAKRCIIRYFYTFIRSSSLLLYIFLFVSNPYSLLLHIFIFVFNICSVLLYDFFLFLFYIRSFVFNICLFLLYTFRFYSIFDHLYLIINDLYAIVISLLFNDFDLYSKFFI